MTRQTLLDALAAWLNVFDSRLLENEADVERYDGQIHFSQAQLNVAKRALRMLWEEYRFEMRYVRPYLS